MLAPIRPRPTIPSFMPPPPLRQGPADRLLESPQAGPDTRAEMHAEGPAAALRQHLEVAARLRRLHHPESIGLSGHRQIGGVPACDLQEDAAVRPALVG